MHCVCRSCFVEVTEPKSSLKPPQRSVSTAHVFAADQFTASYQPSYIYIFMLVIAKPGPDGLTWSSRATQTNDASCVLPVLRIVRISPKQARLVGQREK